MLFAGSGEMCPSPVPERPSKLEVTCDVSTLPTLRSLQKPAKFCSLVPMLLPLCKGLPQWLAHHLLYLTAGLTPAGPMLCCRTAISTSATLACVYMPPMQLSHITQTALT